MFNEHGGFHLKLQGDILYIAISGAWNAETAKAFKAAIDGAIRPVVGQTWAAIIDIEQWELCTPDCELLIVDLVSECWDKGLKRNAIVCEENGVKQELFKKHRKDVAPKISKHAFKRAFFITEALALAWLNQQGYGLSDS